MPPYTPQYTTGPLQGGTSASALKPHRRVVRNNDGTVRYAAAGELCELICRQEVAAAGELVDTMSVFIPGNIPVEADGAITAGALVYPAADGKVSATPNGPAEGRSLTAAGADGDIVTVQPTRGNTQLSGTHTVTAAEADANSNNGLATITPRAGVALGAVIIRVTDAGNGQDNSGYVVSKPTGGSLGSFTVAGVSGGLQLDAGDVIDWVAHV